MSSGVTGGGTTGAGGGSSSAGAINLIQTSDGAGGFLAPANLKGGAGFISYSATPSTVGFMRVGYVAADTIIGIKDSAAADRALVSRSSANINQFGNTSQGTDIHATTITIFSASTDTFIYGASAQGIRLSGTQMLNSRPIIGSGSVYGVHGAFISAMTDANYVVPVTEYIFDTIEVPATLVLTGNRDFTLPTPATEATSYSKFISNQNTSVFSLVIKNGGGATVTLLVNTKAEVVSRPGGVYLKSAAL